MTDYERTTVRETVATDPYASTVPAAPAQTVRPDHRADRRRARTRAAPRRPPGSSPSCSASCRWR